MSKITPPWTGTQVRALNAWQRNWSVHPFTCGGERGDKAHVDYTRLNNQHDMGILVATKLGWYCPVCGYRQDWAHDFMAIPQPDPPKPEIVPAPPSPSKRGFAAMSKAKRRAIAKKGGAAVHSSLRSFSKSRDLAASAGRKGGQNSKGGGRPKEAT